MAVYKLLEDFYEHSYSLIAIHCSLDDYRLAYFLNSYINTKFCKLSFNLKSTNNVTFSMYEWEDEINETKWNLIKNVSKINLEDTAGVLFKKETSTIINYFIPEYNKVDYFIKIDNESIFELSNNLLKKIKEIPKIITAYSVDPNQLKSKNNLIFLSNA